MMNSRVMRLLALVLALVMTVALAACGSESTDESDSSADSTTAAASEETESTTKAASLSKKKAKKLFSDVSEESAETDYSGHVETSTYTVIKMKSTDVNMSVLQYWFDNYLNGDTDYSIIVYTDVEDKTMGCFGVANSMLYKDVEMDPDTHYMIIGTEDATMYMAMDGVLQDMTVSDDTDLEDAEETTVEEDAAE